MLFLNILITCSFCRICVKSFMYRSVIFYFESGLITVSGVEARGLGGRKVFTNFNKNSSILRLRLFIFIFLEQLKKKISRA